MNESNIWHYLLNQFENGTRGSYKRMNIISSDHLSRLKLKEGDPYFDNIINFTIPVRNKFENEYTDWMMIIGIYRGLTLNLESSLNKLINEKVPDWAGKIQAVYHDKTNEYEAIFPDGRQIFNQATYDNRISAVGGLGKRLSTYAEFVEVMDDVNLYYNKLKSIRDNQQKYEGLVKDASDNLEDARKNMATVLYSNLGQLMSYYCKEPLKVTKFFELEHIQRTNNSTTEDEEIIQALNIDGTPLTESDLS